jgi:hypothetical protein
MIEVFICLVVGLIICLFQKGSPTVGFSKYRMTLRQQRLHEGILNGDVANVSACS